MLPPPLRHAEISPVKVNDTMNNKLPQAEILCGEWFWSRFKTNNMVQTVLTAAWYSSVICITVTLCSCGDSRPAPLVWFENRLLHVGGDKLDSIVASLLFGELSVTCSPRCLFCPCSYSVAYSMSLGCSQVGQWSCAARSDCLAACSENQPGYLNDDDTSQHTEEGPKQWIVSHC